MSFRNCVKCNKRFNSYSKETQNSNLGRINCFDCSPKRKSKKKTRTGYIQCSHCDLVMEERFFYKRPSPTRRPCKACHLIASRKKHKIKKQAWVDYLGGECERCGYSKCLAALDFHHKDPTAKENNISDLRGKSINEVKVEMDKCILLCSNCHREHHDST